MENWMYRTELLIGSDNIEKLQNFTVAILGVGGVGSYVAESLVRCGVGNLVLIDSDIIDETNINRQLIATHSDIGKPKVQVAKERYLKINPKINIVTYQEFYKDTLSSKLILKNYDYVIDCIDSVTSKLDLIEYCYQNNIKIISSMGTGNKLSPTLLEVSDIYKTSVCPLAKVIRKELKNRNVKNLKVVYSKEIPIKKIDRNSPIPSISFVPGTAGLILASEVIKDLILTK